MLILKEGLLTMGTPAFSPKSYDTVQTNWFSACHGFGWVFNVFLRVMSIFTLNKLSHHKLKVVFALKRGICYQK